MFSHSKLGSHAVTIKGEEMNAKDESTVVTAADPNVLSPLRESLKGIFKYLGAAAYPFIAAIFYITGFLVTNSNLATHGIIDFEFINMHYFIASAHFLFFLICFYLFAGRSLFLGPKWLARDLERAQLFPKASFWKFLFFINSLIVVAYHLCLSTLLYTMIAIDRQVFFAIGWAPFVIFGVFYIIDITDFDVNFPKITELLKLIGMTTAIICFYATLKSGTTNTVFVVFFIMFVVGNVVLDKINRYVPSLDNFSFHSLYALTFFIIVSSAFGALIFNNIEAKFGGAKPQPVALALSEVSRRALPAPLALSADAMLEGSLIYQTATFTYLAKSSRTIRFRTEDVVLLVSTPQAVPTSVKE